MWKKKFAYILIFCIPLFFIYHVYAGNLPKWFLFDRDAALEEWQEKVFQEKVLYTVESEEGVLSAQSKEACSGLFYRISFSPKKFPMISWRWSVIKFPEKRLTDIKEANDKKGWIEKDDYAARVYVIFPSLNFRRTKCIEYVWDQDMAEGTIMTSPYFKNIKIIVAESGKGNVGKWVLEKKNIYEDYKKVFGSPPRSNVGAIAIMTDTDNTSSTAEALYREIKVGYRDEK